MPFPDIFYDKYDNPRVPAFIATSIGGVALFWAATVGYPNSLKDRTIERVEAEIASIHPGAYVIDGSEKFNIRGKIESTTDGNASVAVDGKACEIKFDTTPHGVDVFPKLGDAACAPLLLQ